MGIADHELRVLKAVGGGFRFTSKPSASQSLPRSPWGVVRDAQRPLPWPWDNAESLQRGSIPTQERGNEFLVSDPELRPRAQSRFPAPFTPVDKRWKKAQKVSLSLTFQPAQRDFQGPELDRQVVS